MSKDEHELRYKFIFPEDFAPKFSNGMWAGISPKGEFNLYFFQDRMPLPKSVFHEIDSSGNIMGETRRDQEDRLVARDVVAGITLNYGDAKAVHEWLGKLLMEFESKAGIQRPTPQ